ncbi:MAG: HAD-IIIA family hydrolase [Candidatus Marinimicrobia bacterium]|nr:HAD-IIIA family hydrolase [Candidatus Neomarinimicrobiota bacterium]
MFFVKKGFLIFIVSNQPDISRKKMLMEELNKIDSTINKKLHIDQIYYSFDNKVIIGGSKKPSPKMIFEARDKWNIDLSKSYFLGDSLVDIECAKNANVSFILVRREHNQDIEHSYCINNLNDFDKMIVSSIIEKEKI